MNYKDYDCYDFLKDEFFVAWVKKPSNESDGFWQTWLKRHPEKQATIEEAKKLLHALHYDVPKLKDTEANEVLENILQEVSLKKHTITDHPLVSTKPNYWYWSAAAVLLLGFFLGILFFQQPINHAQIAQNTKVLQPKIVKENPSGVKSRLKLPDGTIVHLNTNSKISFPKKFDSEKREVWLEGEAFFDVAKNPDRPFTVFARGLATTAIGTSFNIRANKGSDLTEVFLLTGKVKVINNSSDINLKSTFNLVPGEQLTHHKKKNIAVKSNFNRDLIAWIDNTIVFNEADFEYIVSYLSDWYGVDFEIQHVPKNVKNFTGKFNDKSLEEVLKSLSFASGFRFKIENKNVIIY